MPLLLSLSLSATVIDTLILIVIAIVITVANVILIAIIFLIAVPIAIVVGSTFATVTLLRIRFCHCYHEQRISFLLIHPHPWYH